MVSEFDSTIKTSISAIRISVARILSKKMSQQQIAKKLGITQAAVNKYLNGKHPKPVVNLISFIKRKKIDKTIATMVLSGKGIRKINESIDRAVSTIYTSRRK